MYFGETIAESLLVRRYTSLANFATAFSVIRRTRSRLVRRRLASALSPACPSPYAPTPATMSFGQASMNTKSMFGAQAPSHRRSAPAHGFGGSTLEPRGQALHGVAALVDHLVHARPVLRD